MSKILEVNDLCKSFVVKKRLLGENDVVSAVNHVSLGLEEGEVLGIVGESGCGKSTVARLLLHSIRPDSGTMKLCGKEYDMAHATGQDVQTFRKNMQMVFQNPYSSLNPKMNVLQNITFGLTANQVPRDEACRRAYRYLDAVGMQKSFLNKYPNSLSGGQRQRVAIGRAIVRNPRVFMFDEPLSNLDAELRVDMRLHIARLHQELKTTMVYVTHDQVEAMTLAQRVMVMNKGVAEQIGTPVEVYEKPASRFVASFIGSPAMNLLEGRISDDGGRFELAGGMQLPTNHEHRRHAGRKMTLGIRPEHFILSSQAQGGIPLLMDTLEILGADNLAHGRWGEQKLVVRLPHQQRPAAGSTLWLHLPLEHLHLFDGETGQRA